MAVVTAADAAIGERNHFTNDQVYMARLFLVDLSYA